MNDKDIYKDAQKVNLITLLRTFKKEGLENFIVIRRNKFENLLKENEELKMKIHFINNNNLDDLYEKTLEKTMIKFLNDNIEKDFIPVAKIEEKKEELTKIKEEYASNSRYQNELQCAIDILQDLLEGK